MNSVSLACQKEQLIWRGVAKWTEVGAQHNVTGKKDR